MPQICPYSDRCGGCRYIERSYEEQLALKQAQMTELFKGIITPEPIVGMTASDCYGYRHKVQMAFSESRNGGNRASGNQRGDFRNGSKRGAGQRTVSCGNYEEESHTLVATPDCLINHPQANAVIEDVRKLCEKLKLPIYNEKTCRNGLRYVQVRVSHQTGDLMVILVTGEDVFPGQNNLVKELRKAHPEIKTIIHNTNGNRTSMVLTNRMKTIFGPGYINDEMLGKTFRISPGSFYQINPVQTEKLYNKATELLNSSLTDRVLDAYCGTGTIGLIASDNAKEVIGVELNAAAVADAKLNAGKNGVTNARFVKADASDYLVEKEPPDLVIMDPPRSGSTEKFLTALATAGPKRIVYISCGPDTQKRDIQYLAGFGYRPEVLIPYDLFPFTSHVETVILMSKILN